MDWDIMGAIFAVSISFTTFASAMYIIRKNLLSTYRSMEKMRVDIDMMENGISYSKHRKRANQR